MGLASVHSGHQHAEHRVFVPNLIVLLLARTTHFNILVEEYLSGVMLCVAIGLLILADKRSSPSTPWIYYCPVALVLLSFVQVGSMLFGFQLSWYLAILAFAVALFLLDRTDLTKLVLAGAIAAAVVGSFSAFEGLFIWPVGLMVLYHRRCPRGLVLAWIASAAVTAAAYFHNYILLKEILTGSPIRPWQLDFSSLPSVMWWERNSPILILAMSRSSCSESSSLRSRAGS